MNVLITGVSGFVGRHLLRAVEEASEGNKAWGTSFPEKPPSSSRRAVYLDLRKESDVLPFIKDIRPDRIFHLAAVSNVRHSWLNRHETMETNVLGTQNLLEAVRIHVPRARFLFISSADVYGVSISPPKAFSEDDSLSPSSPYACSKAAGELICSFYSKVEGLDVVIARPFPHTGPGQSPDFVCSDWARQIVLIEKGESKPVLRVGNLDVQRDFCDVRDVVNAYQGLMSKGSRGETYNVCSGKGIALREIMDVLRGKSLQKNPVSLEVDPDKLRKVDAPFLVGNNHKISAATGWSPAIPISQTLEDLLSHWRKSV